MPNARNHAIVGAVVGATVYCAASFLLDRKPQIGEFLLAGGIGAVCGLAADLFEPALSPHHRRFFHSATTAILVGRAAHGAWTHPNFPAEHRSMFSAACLAYLSHLLLDAQTPAGLPII